MRVLMFHDGTGSGDYESAEDFDAHMTRTRRSIRRWSIAIVLLVLVLAANTFFAVQSRQKLDNEIDARTNANTESLVVGCRNVNDLARSVRKLVEASSQETVTDAAIAAAPTPEVAKLLEVIRAQSNANRADVAEAADGIRLLDCSKAVERATNG